MDSSVEVERQPALTGAGSGRLLEGAAIAHPQVGLTICTWSTCAKRLDLHETLGRNQHPRLWLWRLSLPQPFSRTANTFGRILRPARVWIFCCRQTPRSLRPIVPLIWFFRRRFWNMYRSLLIMSQSVFVLLKPGGFLVLTTHGLFGDHGCPYDFQRWTADGLRLLLERAGFQIKGSEEANLWPTGALLLCQPMVLAVTSAKVVPIWVCLVGFSRTVALRSLLAESLR